MRISIALENNIKHRTTMLASIITRAIKIFLRFFKFSPPNVFVDLLYHKSG